MKLKFIILLTCLCLMPSLKSVQTHNKTISEQEKLNMQLFIAASERNNVEEIHRLVEQGAEADMVYFPTGDTPLMNVASHNECSIAKYFLEHGAKADVVNNDGRTALAKLADLHPLTRTIESYYNDDRPSEKHVLVVDPFPLLKILFHFMSPTLRTQQIEKINADYRIDKEVKKFLTNPEFTLQDEQEFAEIKRTISFNANKNLVNSIE